MVKFILMQTGLVQLQMIRLPYSHKREPSLLEQQEMKDGWEV